MDVNVISCICAFFAAMVAEQGAGAEPKQIQQK
jgi:hypothetical protein